MSRITAGIGLKQYLLAHIFILIWSVYACHKLLQNLICHQVLFFKRSTEGLPRLNACWMHFWVNTSISELMASIFTLSFLEISLSL